MIKVSAVARLRGSRWKHRRRPSPHPRTHHITKEDDLYSKKTQMTCIACIGFFKSTAENVSNTSDETSPYSRYNEGRAMGRMCGCSGAVGAIDGMGLGEGGVEITFHPSSRGLPATWSSPAEESRELKHADRFFTASSPFFRPRSPHSMLMPMLASRLSPRRHLLGGNSASTSSCMAANLMYLYCANEHSDIPCASSQPYPLLSTVSQTQQV